MTVHATFQGTNVPLTRVLLGAEGTVWSVHKEVEPSASVGAGPASPFSGAAMLAVTAPTAGPVVVTLESIDAATLRGAVVGEWTIAAETSLVVAVTLPECPWGVGIANLSAASKTAVTVTVTGTTSG